MKIYIIIFVYTLKISKQYEIKNIIILKLILKFVNLSHILSY